MRCSRRSGSTQELAVIFSAGFKLWGRQLSTWTCQAQPKCLHQQIQKHWDLLQMWELKAQDSPGDNPAPAWQSVMLLPVRTNPGLANRRGGGSASPPSNTSGFHRKMAHKFPRSSRSPPPMARTDLPAATIHKGDCLLERSSQTLLFKDLIFLQERMIRRRWQCGCHLGKGTACTSELMWDGWISP